LIPKCGCYFPSNNNYLFFVKDVELVKYDYKKTILHLDIISKIKNHIYYIGPVIGTCNILSNFNGNLLQATNGIYIDSFDYKKNNIELTGGHAVVILGWGIELFTITTYGKKYTEIPYWYCRNTYGTEWGESGYFKFAMYPINQKSVLEVNVSLVENNKTQDSGGIYMFKSGKIENSTFNKINPTPTSKDLIKSEDWYMKGDSFDKKLVNHISINFIFNIILTTIIIILLIKLCFKII